MRITNSKRSKGNALLPETGTDPFYTPATFSIVDLYPIGLSAKVTKAIHQVSVSGRHSPGNGDHL